jgi:5-methylcytosine-specific restriction protein A
MPYAPRVHRPLRPEGRRLKPKEDNWGKGRGGHRWRQLRRAIFERDGYQCQICKDSGVPRIVALSGPQHGVCDHIVPKAAGGTDDPSNLQCICQDCDRKKTGREARDFQRRRP